MYQFKTLQWLPISLNEAWDFFSSPLNLAKITPPELDFKILTPVEGKEIYNGMLIDYRVKPLFGIPVHWQTEICKVEKPFIFADRQLKGPYKVWHHTHIFREENGGVMMEDIVDYEIPLGALGRLAQILIVKRKVESIFEFRRKTLENFLKNKTC
jgi:ligand-binding SRPBCC domain-containing protein